MSASIAKRLISIKVLVQEEVLKDFRSVGSCVTEGQLKCMIALENSVCFTNQLQSLKRPEKRTVKLLKTFLPPIYNFILKIS